MSSNIRITRVCAHCGKDFTAKTTVTQFCSHRCSRAAYKARVRNYKVKGSNIETAALKVAAIDHLKSKDFLTVKDTSALLNCSLRTTYRLIAVGTIPAVNLSERKTIIRRSDLERVFDNAVKEMSASQQQVVEIPQFQVADCYTLTEVQKKYGISDKALYDLIKRNAIPKIKKGWFSYVPKKLIDRLLYV
jgi:excisionase family DNA binding protein